MKMFRRISATINAQINTLIDEIENHEAVADLALADIREALLRAKYQIHRVQSEQRSLGEKLKDLRSAEKRWSERALRIKESDRDQALECVRRIKQAREDIDATELQLAGHEELERKLAEDVRAIEKKFEELKRKRSELAARESRAQALTAVSRHQEATDVGGVFDRWELEVMRGEAEGEFPSEGPRDSFEEKFKSEEERAELETLLNELSKQGE
jgi:phage shock protein A